jgi:hypothetical protein
VGSLGEKVGGRLVDVGEVPIVVEDEEGLADSGEDRVGGEGVPVRTSLEGRRRRIGASLLRASSLRR